MNLAIKVLQIACPVTAASRFDDNDLIMALPNIEEETGGTDSRHLKTKRAVKVDTRQA